MRQLGTFGRFSSTFAGGLREQRLGFLLCTGSIGACAETVYFLRKSQMADGRLEVFRRALLGRGFFAHVAPLRSRPGVASVIWESLLSIRRCSREHFADNRSSHSFFIYIDILADRPALRAGLSACLAYDSWSDTGW